MINEQRILFLPGETGEKALLARLEAGEDAAYRECYQSFAPQVLRVLMRVLRNQAQAEEILQDTFVAAFKSIGQFRGETRLSTWLSRIAINRAYNCIRDEGRRNKNLPVERADEAPALIPQLEGRDLSRRVMAILDTMDAAKRMALLLAAEGYSVAEIAECSGEPRGTILARLSRARIELGERIAAAGLPAPAKVKGMEGRT
jgi:RNA polymerase sigma-70 factor (ECF subfamily)